MSFMFLYLSASFLDSKHRLRGFATRIDVGAWPGGVARNTQVLARVERGLSYQYRSTVARRQHTQWSQARHLLSQRHEDKPYVNE